MPRDALRPPTQAPSPPRRTDRSGVATRRPAGVVLLAAAMTLAACSGDDASDEAAAVTVVVDDEGGATDTAATTSTTSDEEAALAFAACMRDEGIDVPDPTVGADGSIQFGDGGGGGAGLQGQDGVDDAFAACQDTLAGASFLPGGQDPAEQAELEDTLLSFAACLREQGLDVDDPDLSGGLQPGRGGLFGDAFDPADPANADAIEACQDELVGLPLGGGR